VLLDDYEPGMKTTEVASLFSELKSELTPMIAAITAHADRVDDSVLHGSFPIDQQRRLTLEVIQRMGFDRAAWRIDDAVHPFASGLSSQDVRITTRWEESYFASSL
jgi:carboxypeptidase Taq